MSQVHLEHRDASMTGETHQHVGRDSLSRHVLERPATNRPALELRVVRAEVSRHFVDAKVLSIFEGTEETLAVRVVGREMTAN